MKITSTKTQSTHRLKILVYGQAGAGKTSLAASLKEPVLIISAEAGLLSLSSRDIDVIDISVDDEGKSIAREDRLARLGMALEFVSTQNARDKYKWLFIDSLTEISQNLSEALNKICSDPKDGLKMWGEYAKKMRSLVKSFRDIPYFNVCFTALDAEDHDENMRRFTRIDMQGKIAKQLPAYFDEVFWLHVEKETGKRLFLCQPRDNVVAKDRSGKLAQIEEANLQAVTDKIRK